MKRSYDSQFKSLVALAAWRDDKTIAEIAGEFDLHKILSMFISKFKKKKARPIQKTVRPFSER